MSKYDEAISVLSIIGGILAVICAFLLEEHPIPALIGMCIALTLVVIDRVYFSLLEIEHLARMDKIHRRIRRIDEIA